MGCSNTKAFPAGMDSNGTLTNAINVLNTVDPSQVKEEGEKLINQAQEVIEKSAAAVENVMNGKSPFEGAENEENASTEDSSKFETVPEEPNAEEKTKVVTEEAQSETLEPTVSRPSEVTEEPSVATEEPSVSTEEQSAENVESDSQPQVEEVAEGNTTEASTETEEEETSAEVQEPSESEEASDKPASEETEESRDRNATVEEENTEEEPKEMSQ